MIQMPQVTAERKNEQEIELELYIPKDLIYFVGHFPDYPVLPGIIQLRWVEILARNYGMVTKEFVRLDKLKFQRIISSDYEVTLKLKCADENTILFQYISEHGQHASGKFVFG